MHYLQWSAESRTLRRPGPDWLPVRPFWRDLSDAGRRVLIVDVPMTPAPERLRGVEISGWSAHDRLEPPASYPPEVMQGIVNEFGECPLGDEIFGCTGVRTALATRDEMIASTRRLADLVTAWLGRGRSRPRPRPFNALMQLPLQQARLIRSRFKEIGQLWL